MDYQGIKPPDAEPAAREDSHEPYISPYPKVTGETTARMAKPRSSRIETEPKKPCEKKFICPLCKKGFSRRQTVFDPHFASCIKKNGNPHGLEWDDDPSCQETREGQPGLFKSGRVAPGSIRAMQKYGNLTHQASEVGDPKTNAEDNDDTEAEDKDIVDDVKGNGSSRRKRGPQGSGSYQHPDTYDPESDQPRAYHHTLGNRPEVGPGTVHVRSSRDNRNNVHFSRSRGVDPSLTESELDKAKPLRTTQTACVNLKLAPPIKQSHNTPLDPVLSNPTRRGTVDAASLNDSNLFQTKPPSLFANSHTAQPLHLDSRSFVQDQSTLSPVVPKTKKGKKSQNKTAISTGQQEGPLRIQDNPYSTVTPSPIQLDFITIQTSILRSLMAGIVRETGSNVHFQSEQFNMAASSHDKHGSGEAGSSTSPANQMTTASVKRGAMRTYGTNTRGLSQPVEAGPSKPGLQGKRRLTEKEAAAIIKYLCGPNEEVPNIMGNSLKHANSWLTKEHGSLMEIINVLGVVLHAKAVKNQGAEPMDYEEGSSTEEAESRAAESILVPDAIVQHQMPSPVVDEELGSSMHEAASPADDSSPEPDATMEDSITAAAQMALQILQQMAADVKTLSDSKNLINLVKESLISLSEENEAAEVDEIIVEEINEIAVDKSQAFQFPQPGPAEGGRRVATEEERAAFLHKYSGYPHLYDNDYP